MYPIDREDNRVDPFEEPTAPMDVSEFRGPFIITYPSGKRFHFLNPDAESVVLEDIANSLGRLCRYTGHIPAHYSVAEHSVHVMRFMMARGYIEGPYARAALISALFHDAAEAYTGDVNKPLKVLLAPLLKPIEDRIDDVIRRALKLPDVYRVTREAIHHADLVMLATEMETLKPAQGGAIGGAGELSLPAVWADAEIQCWPADLATQRFLYSARALGVGV